MRETSDCGHRKGTDGHRGRKRSRGSGSECGGFYRGVLLAVDVVDSEERWPGREDSVANLDIVILVNIVSEV